MTDLTKSGCTDLYTSQNGTVTQIQDLNSSHLANILRKMEREAKVTFAFGKAKRADGEPATKWADCLPPEYSDLEDEALYRGLDWRQPQ